MKLPPRRYDFHCSLYLTLRVGLACCVVNGMGCGASRSLQPLTMSDEDAAIQSIVERGLKEDRGEAVRRLRKVSLKVREGKSRPRPCSAAPLPMRSHGQAGEERAASGRLHCSDRVASCVVSDSGACASRGGRVVSGAPWLETGGSIRRCVRSVSLHTRGRVTCG